MLYFISSSHLPAFNLATEEYLLKNHEEDFFFLYSNSPALIVGKHQNTLAEINLEKTEQENIPVVRRLSGGGTVFHDEGNLNYCFIKKGEKGKLVDFKKYSSPIIDTLQKLKVDAKFEGKSDLTIAGKKFSGNASHVYRNKVMQHGTMLFSSDLKRLNQLLKVNPLKFKDRGVRSIRSRVTNISDSLSSPMSLSNFADLIIEEVKLKFPEAQEFILSENDLREIELLVTEKYDNWNWNYGYSPNYVFEKLSNFPGGTLLEIRMEITKGIIQNIALDGNCIQFEKIETFKKMLLGVQHDKNTVLKQLKSLSIDSYFKNLSLNQLLNAFF
jgi:lipoate-protein ligase A